MKKILLTTTLLLSSLPVFANGDDNKKGLNVYKNLTIAQNNAASKVLSYLTPAERDNFTDLSDHGMPATADNNKEISKKLHEASQNYNQNQTVRRISLAQFLRHSTRFSRKYYGLAVDVMSDDRSTFLSRDQVDALNLQAVKHLEAPVQNYAALKLVMQKVNPRAHLHLAVKDCITAARVNDWLEDDSAPTFKMLESLSLCVDTAETAIKLLTHLVRECRYDEYRMDADHYPVIHMFINQAVRTVNYTKKTPDADDETVEFSSQVSREDFRELSELQDTIGDTYLKLYSISDIVENVCGTDQTDQQIQAGIANESLMPYPHMMPLFMTYFRVEDQAAAERFSSVWGRDGYVSPTTIKRVLSFFETAYGDNDYKLNPDDFQQALNIKPSELTVNISQESSDSMIKLWVISQFNKEIYSDEHLMIPLLPATERNKLTTLMGLFESDDLFEVGQALAQLATVIIKNNGHPSFVSCVTAIGNLLQEITNCASSNDRLPTLTTAVSFITQHKSTRDLSRALNVVQRLIQSPHKDEMVTILHKVYAKIDEECTMHPQMIGYGYTDFLLSINPDFYHQVLGISNRLLDAGCPVDTTRKFVTCLSKTDRENWDTLTAEVLETIASVPQDEQALLFEYSRCRGSQDGLESYLTILRKLLPMEASQRKIFYLMMQRRDCGWGGDDIHSTDMLTSFEIMPHLLKLLKVSLYVSDNSTFEKELRTYLYYGPGTFYTVFKAAYASGVEAVYISVTEMVDIVFAKDVWKRGLFLSTVSGFDYNDCRANFTSVKRLYEKLATYDDATLKKISYSMSGPRFRHFEEIRVNESPEQMLQRLFG